MGENHLNGIEVSLKSLPLEVYTDTIPVYLRREVVEWWSRGDFDSGMAIELLEASRAALEANPGGKS